MRFKGKLFGVLLVFVAVSLMTASGAFTTATADRTVSVNVSNDTSALLQLEPHSGSNGAYASASNGELEINFDNVGATGVNQNATTTLTDVFNITNQGTQTVTVYITKTGNNSGAVTFQNASGSQIDGGIGNGMSVPVGETVEVSLKINTTGQNYSSGDQLLESITIHAEA